MGGMLRAWKPRGGGIVFAAVVLMISALVPYTRLRASRALQARTTSDTQVSREVALAAHLDSLREPLAALRERAVAAPRPTLLLGAITSMLPGDARLLDFDIDSAGAQFTVVTASLQPFLRRLERLQQYQIALASDISTDTTGGERATVMLRVKHATARTGGR